MKLKLLYSVKKNDDLSKIVINLLPPPYYLQPAQISLVIAAVIGVIVYRLAIRGFIAKTPLSDDIAVSSMIISGAGASANFIFILFMSTIYYKLAHFLTDWGEQELPVRERSRITSAGFC